MKIGVNENERREIIENIGELEIQHCRNCELVKTFDFNYVSSNCVKQCEIGKQIHDLGKQLDQGREFKTGIILTKQRYLKLKLKDLDDQDIMEMYEIGRKKLRNMRKKWGIAGNQLDYGLELMKDESKKSNVRAITLLK